MLQINPMGDMPAAANGDLGLQSDLSVIDLVHSAIGMVKRQSWTILVITLCALSLGALYLYITPPSYTAIGTMVIDTRKTQFLKEQPTVATPSRRRRRRSDGGRNTEIAEDKPGGDRRIATHP